MSSNTLLSAPVWTKEQDKEFENCLALYSGEANDRWEKIAAALTGKSREEIINHYQLLVEDVNAIETGYVPFPFDVDSTSYCEEKSPLKQVESDDASRKNGKSDKRPKGKPWTMEEHRLFLLGLDKFGKGDWRSVSRHFVKSRTPTQVASHAQKYFHRLKRSDDDRKRSSIHDVTRVDNEGTLISAQPVTGLNNGASSSGSSSITGNSSTSPVAGICIQSPPMAFPVNGRLNLVPDDTRLNQVFDFNKIPAESYLLDVPNSSASFPYMNQDASSF